MAEKEIILTNIEMYNEIVSSAYAHYKELMVAHDKLLTSESETNTDLDSKVYALQNAMDSTAAVILVFSEITLEAFCNAYLWTKYSKVSFEKMDSIKKVDHSIVTMLSECGTSITDVDASNYYGGDIPRIIKIRKKFVHRYPVKFSLALDSDEKFEKDVASSAAEIEDQFLRRIERADVENAATAYQKFKDKLSLAGVDFGKMGFIC